MLKGTQLASLIAYYEFVSDNMKNLGFHNLSIVTKNELSNSGAIQLDLDLQARLTAKASEYNIMTGDSIVSSIHSSPNIKRRFSSFTRGPSFSQRGQNLFTNQNASQITPETSSALRSVSYNRSTNTSSNSTPVEAEKVRKTIMTEDVVHEVHQDAIHSPLSVEKHAKAQNFEIKQ